MTDGTGCRGIKINRVRLRGAAESAQNSRTNKSFFFFLNRVCDARSLHDYAGSDGAGQLCARTNPVGRGNDDVTGGFDDACMDRERQKGPTRVGATAVRHPEPARTKTWGPNVRTHTKTR